MDESDDNSSDITLDQIDSYLSRNNYMAYSNEIEKLWVKDKYYEFNVITDRVFKESDCFDELSNLNKYNCQICNVDVPLAYAKDHNNSFKHRTCLKITDLALERARLHFKHHNDVPNLRIQLNSTYFCEPCAAVVQVADKSKHEKSKTHTVSVKHDKLLNYLLFVYTDRNNVTIDFQVEQTTEMDFKKDNIVESELDKITEDVTNNIKPQLNANDANNCLKTYLETICKTYNKPLVHSLAVVNYDCIEITALNGDKIVVPNDNFNGFKKLGDHIQCKLCKVLIDGSIESHKLTEIHMDRVTLPITDKHCVRQIENWNHCLLCNDLFFDVDLHTQSGKHNSVLEQAKVYFNSAEKQTPVKKRTRTRSKKTKGATCDIDIDSINFAAHINTNGDTLNCKDGTMTSSSNVTAENPQENIHYHISKTASTNEYICNVCKTTIPYKNIAEHVKGSGHNVKFNELLSSNSIQLIDNGFHCNICNVFISKINIIDHVDTRTHISLLNQLVSQKTAIASSSKIIDVPSTGTDTVGTANQDYCNICNVKVPQKGMEIHNKGKPHKNKLLTLSVKQKALAKVNVQIPAKVNEQTATKVNARTASKINAQIAAKVNAQTTAKVNTQTAAKVNTQTAAKVNTQTAAKANAQVPAIVSHYLMRQTKNPNSFLCIVCNVQVPKTSENVREHVKGGNHNMNYNEILSTNKLIKRDDNDMQYYCKICEIVVEHREEIAHVNDILHEYNCYELRCA